MTFSSNIVPLKTVIGFKKGKKPKEIFNSPITDSLPYLLIESFGKVATGHTNDKTCRVATIQDTLLVCDGARTGLASTGHHGYIGSTLAALSPDVSKLLPKYLYYFIRDKYAHLNTRTRGATIPHLDRELLFSLNIRLTSLLEQHQSVDILSRAEAIVRLRHESEKKADEIIPALFIDMFGDPKTNPNDWSLRKVSSFVSKFEGGKNIQAGSELGSDYRILKVSAATKGIYLEHESKPAPDGYLPPQSHIIRMGDMLFSRANTFELVGATAIVENTNGQTLLPDKLWRFVWSEPVEIEYMHALFQSSAVRAELSKLSSGTSASMRNISQAKLFNLQLPIAPLSLQKEFAEKAAVVKSIQTQQIIATAKAQATFDALLAQVFQA